MSDHEGEGFGGAGRLRNRAIRPEKQRDESSPAASIANIQPNASLASARGNDYVWSASTQPQQPILAHYNARIYHPQSSSEYSYAVRPKSQNQHSGEIKVPSFTTSTLCHRQQPDTSEQGDVVTKFRLDGPHTDVYELPIPWSVFVAGLSINMQSARTIARGFLDQICKNTDTYMPVPNGNSMELKIWGLEKQVFQAKIRLDNLVKSQKTEREGPHKWDKFRAFDGRREHRAEVEGQLSESNLAFNNLTFGTKLDYEAFMIWPRRDGFLEFEDQFQLRFPSDRLQKAPFRILFRTSPIEHICIQAPSEMEVLSAYYRVAVIAADTKLHEQFKRLVRWNTLRLPVSDFEKGQVHMTRDPKTNLFLPKFYSPAAIENPERLKWQKIQRRWNRYNRSLIQTELDKALQALQTSNKYVRMRLTFGHLGFQRFKKPDSIGSNDNISLKGFCESFADPRMRLTQIPLCNDKETARELISGLERSGLFEPPTDHYSALFDFQVSAKGKTLRLENEFKFTNLEDELEMCGQRWLEYDEATADEVIEINLFDFDQPGVQFHVGAVRRIDESLIDSRLSKFRVNIGFQPVQTGITESPKRRATYPLGQSTLFRLKEVYIKKFYMLETGGIFELRRTDVYNEKLSAYKSNLTPQETSWTGSYYFAEWDNLLGQTSRSFLDINPSSDHQLGVALFFQEGLHQTIEEGLPKGFRAFMKDVDQLQDILTRLLPRETSVPQSRAATKQDVPDLLI